MKHRLTFLTALAAGFAAHAAAFFGNLSYHDDVYNLFDVGNTWYLGRFTLGVLGKLVRLVTGTSHFSLPWFHGTVTLLLLAVTACLLCELFDITDRAPGAVCGAVMTTMPYTAAFFGFMFTAPYYALAICLTVLGCTLAVRACAGGENGRKTRAVFFCGIALLVIAAGIYQAVLPFAATVFLAVLVLRAADAATTRGRFFREGMLYALALVCALAVYLVCMRLFLKMLHLQVSDYGGMDRMGSVSAGQYVSRVITAYRTFFLPEKVTSWNMYPATSVWLYALAVLGIAVCAVLCVRGRGRAGKADPVQILLPLLLMPLACNGAFVMNDEAFIHSLVMFPQAVLFFLLVALTIRVSGAAAYAPRIGCLLAALLVLFYVRYDNICYFSAGVLYENTKAYYDTMITRIRSADGYDDALPVVFIGERGIADESLTLYPAFEAVITTPYANSQEVRLNDYAWKAFLAYRSGYAPAWGDAAAFEGHAEVAAMPCYPDDGSVRVIDDTVVIKLQ
ncbi:MAG: glucosyltransferase domain-containing protein [Lachnospiraceae bacterium]|nr:glucosyltransferase domain-containing protein [Lachnospiraceae bacterium]